MIREENGMRAAQDSSAAKAGGNSREACRLHGRRLPGQQRRRRRAVIIRLKREASRLR